jgi:hypothetical protein
VALKSTGTILGSSGLGMLELPSPESERLNTH